MESSFGGVVLNTVKVTVLRISVAKSENFHLNSSISVYNDLSSIIEFKSNTSVTVTNSIKFINIYNSFKQGIISFIFTYGLIVS